MTNFKITLYTGCFIFFWLVVGPVKLEIFKILVGDFFLVGNFQLMAGFYGHALSALVKMCARDTKNFKILLKIDSFCVSCFVCVIHSFFRGNKYLTGGLWWKRLAFGRTIWLIFDNWWRILVLRPLCLKTFETNQVSTKLLIKALRKVWYNGGMGWVGGWFIHIRVWAGGQGGGLIS